MTRETERGVEYRANDSVAAAFDAPKDAATTKVSLSTSAAEATGLAENGTYRLWSDVSCFVRFASSGDATTSDMPLTAELPEWITLSDLTRISAIVASGTGSLYITKCGA